MDSTLVVDVTAGVLFDIIGIKYETSGMKLN